MPENKKKIAYVSGTRADYGLMVPVLEAVRKSKKLKLLLYACGMHIMKSHGETIQEVKRRYPSVKILKATFREDNREAQVHFMSSLMKELVVAFQNDRPVAVLVLGDRPEMLAVATVCAYLQIPCGHIHGGERTGTVDEITRHAITKLCHFHFAASKDSARRIERMGEEKRRIFFVGAPAADVIVNEKLPSRKKLFEALNISEEKNFILVTLHPENSVIKESERQMKNVMDAALSFHMNVVVIYPNSDPGNKGIIRAIKSYEKMTDVYAYKNVSHKIFLALEKEASAWVGNSSAAMIESSFFNTPVINVGSRQKNRLCGNNVLHTSFDEKEIREALKKSIFDTRHIRNTQRTKNPWGSGTAGRQIAKILENMSLDENLLHKQITY